MVVFDNENNVSNSKCERIGRVLNVNDMLLLQVDDKVRIELTFTRNTRSESFDIVNNFSLLITAVE